MHSIGEALKNIKTGALGNLLNPIRVSDKTCPQHGAYQEQVFKNFTLGCPQCAREQEQAAEAQRQAERQERQREQTRRQIEKRIGASRIPKRFLDKSVSGYRIDAQDEQQRQAQRYVIERIKAYAGEFSTGHSGRNLALLGNAGTGKTHLACAIARHVINNCNGWARFTSVSEINRIIREAKSYNSDVSETEVIQSFGGYDLLVIDEVGVQSGTEAESRALFDVFNERYQNCKPTILLSNLCPTDFAAAVGDRIADRIKEDGGEVLLFNWESRRG